MMMAGHDNNNNICNQFVAKCQLGFYTTGVRATVTEVVLCYNIAIV